MIRSVSLAKSPISVGILPTTLLKLKDKADRFVRRPISVGIVPTRFTALKKINDSSFVNRPISVGILPTRFPLGSRKDNCIRFCKSPISDGMHLLLFGPTPAKSTVAQFLDERDKKLQPMHNGVD